MKRRWDKLRKRWRRDGAWAVLRRGGTLAVARYIYAEKCYYFVRLDTSREIKTLRKRLAKTEFRLLTPEEVVSISYARGRRKKRDFAAFMDSKCRCFAIICDRTVIAHVFAAAQSQKEKVTGYVMDADDRRLFLLDATTAPEFRGRGVAIELLIELTRHARREGVKEFVAFVDEADKRARRTWKRIGFEPYGKLRHRRLFGGLLKFNTVIEWDAVHDPF